MFSTGLFTMLPTWYYSTSNELSKTGFRFFVGQKMMNLLHSLHNYLLQRKTLMTTIVLHCMNLQFFSNIHDICP